MTYIRVIPFPTAIKGYTVKDADGNFNIYINAALGWGEQWKTLEHEIRHIRKKHFDRNISVRQAESEAGNVAEK